MRIIKSNKAIGSKADASATTDTDSFSLIALFKRLLEKWTAGVSITGGSVAHDAPSTANPVLTGFVAESTIPTAVADGDLSVDAGTLYGARFVNPVTSAGAQVTGATGAAVPAGAMALGGSDGTNLDMLRVIDSVAADGITAPTSGNLSVAAMLFADNGTTKDRWRNNTEGTMLASAARTAATATSLITNYNARGVMLFLNVTAGGGAGGLKPRIESFASGNYTYVALNADPTAVNAINSTYVYILYPGESGSVSPGSSNAVQQITSRIVPRQWRVTVNVVDTTSITYSLNYALIL